MCWLLTCLFACYCLTPSCTKLFCSLMHPTSLLPHAPDPPSPCALQMD
jgi:hypothetical protein